MLDDAAKFDNSPPETMISLSIKSVDASERVKVSAAFSPAFKLSTSDVISIVGRTVSILRVTILSASYPSLLVFPKESENFVSSTNIIPSVVLSAVGVNVAV